jgi:hypothetical protein
MEPLTHHEIFRLVEPFSRIGRQVDLASSNRAQRVLVFKPVDLRCELQADANWNDVLRLECPPSGAFLLERKVRHPSGLAARLESRGPQVAELLTLTQSVAAQDLFRESDGYLLAYSYSMNTQLSGKPKMAESPFQAMNLRRVEVRLNSLTLTLKMPTVQGYPADLVLTSDDALELPDDLLEVIGRDWGRLLQRRSGWHTTLEIRGKEPERSRTAESQVELACRHLAKTLAQAPANFHRLHAHARWRIAARRTIPLVSMFALVGGALAVPYLLTDPDSVLRMLILNLPPVLLVIGLCMRDIPSFELPHAPRRMSNSSWHKPPGTSAV